MNQFEKHIYFLRGEGAMNQVTINRVSLGPNNKGNFGPDDSVDLQLFERDIQGGEYCLPATNRWICIDGREPAVSRANTRLTGEVDPQIPGGPAVTDTAADLMNPETVGKVRLRERLVANTSAHINRGNIVVVHGDDHHGFEGCAASDIEANLQYGAENADIVAPIVWSVSKLFGLDRLGVTEQDVNESLLAGGKNAVDKNVIDVTKRERVEIQINNGAEYEELRGPHHERLTAIELEEDKAFDNQRFAEDHVRPDGTRDEAFGMALGKYVHESVRALIAEGRSVRDAALHAMRVIAFAVSLNKRIGNEDIEAWLLGTVRPVTV